MLQRLLVPAVCAVQTHQLEVDVGVIRPQPELRLKQLVQLVGGILSSCAQKLLLQRENCELRGQRVFSEQADVTHTDPQIEDGGMSRQEPGSFLHPELGPAVRLRFAAQQLRHLQNQVRLSRIQIHRTLRVQRQTAALQDEH